MINATKAASLVRAGELSPVELVNECLGQIDRLDSTLQAWVHVDREGAQRTAQERLQEARNGVIRGPLHGIPVGVKDILDVAGTPTRAGAASFAHYTPQADAAVVTRLRDAGAIILGKTAATEFAYIDPAPTRNPWNIQHTPGGSSSGSGAAVAAGMVPMAIGSQTVGSTLRPAAFCGIVGLKPTYNLISTAGAIPLAWSLDHVGVLASDVSDAALFLQAVAGVSPIVRTALPMATPGPGASPEQRPSIGLLRWSYDEQQADEEITGHIAAIAHLLARNSARIEEVDSPAGLATGLAAGYLVMRSEAAAYHLPAFAQHRDLYGPGIRDLVDAGLATAATDYVLAQRTRAMLRKELIAMLTRSDVLMLPVAATTAPRGLQSTGSPNPFCGVASFTGLPAIALPSGLSRDGLPLSIQLVGRPWQEATLLRIATWVEAQLDFKLSPPLQQR